MRAVILFVLVRVLWKQVSLLPNSSSAIIDDFLYFGPKQIYLGNFFI